MEKMCNSNKVRPEKQMNFQANHWFWAFFLLTAGTGCFLRLYLISDQVLLNDEWHALNFSANHSLWYLLTHFSYGGANSIPVNAYVRLLLVSFGWSEILLILPSLIAGITSLFVFPLVLKRFFSARIAIFFSFLLAISPFIISYSRVCRPYSIYTFLGFLSIWLIFKWSLSGGKKFGILFALNGIFCIYFHFVGVIFVFVPLCCVFIVKLMSKLHRLNILWEKVVPDFTEIICVGCGILFGLAILLTAAIIQRLPFTGDPAHYTLNSIIGSMPYFSGTSHLFLNIFFYVLLGIGIVRSFMKSLLLGFIFTSVFTAYVVVLLITKSPMSNYPLVLLRYIIPAFPICYILVANGLDSLCKLATSLKENKLVTSILCYGIIGFFLYGLVWTSPLWQIYKTPNNFTNHIAFMESYAPIDWENPPVSLNFPTGSMINENTTSTFYKSLANQPNIKKIIEYPMLMGSNYNPFFYYQRFHGKKVAVGYTRAIKDSLNKTSALIYCDMMMDYVLSQVKNPEQLKFKNMVDMLDMIAINNTRAELVIIHKNPIVEILKSEAGDNGSRYPGLPLIVAVAKIYRKTFGQPIFEDRHIVVFKVHG